MTNESIIPNQKGTTTTVTDDKNYGTNEIPMKEYFYKKNSKGEYDIYRKWKVQEIWTATTNTRDIAEFLCNAANNFNPDAVTTVVTEYP